MIPLVSIKNHILNDFSPYFYVYSPSILKDLAFTNPQTNLKGYNESFLKKGKENISLYQSNLNTVKLLFLKLHEYSHSKFSGNYNFELSPQIVFKTNLIKFSNDKALSRGIIEKTLNYKYKKYISKFSLSNEDKNEEVPDDENYIDIIYNYFEDVGDEIGDNDKNMGECVAAMEYYLSNNIYCTNFIVIYEGDLNSLLNIELYIGESLLSLKRIIEKKIKVLYNRKPELIKKIIGYDNHNIPNYRNIKKGPGEMLTHNDIGLLIHT